MKCRIGNWILNVLLMSLLSMLLPMILATRVLGSSSYLTILYMLGYTVQIVSVAYVLWMFPIRINKNSVRVLVMYIVILTLPFINDIAKGIPINYYDPINSIIKVINLFIFYVLIENIEINQDALFRFMRVIVILSVFACLYSIIFEFHDILSIRYISNTNVLKIRSFFSNRNQYSAFLVIALTANLYCCQIKKRKSNSWIFVSQMLGILSTFSRAALFSAIIIIGLMVLQAKNTKKKIIFIFLSVVIGIGILFTTGIFDYFIRNYIRWGQSADSGRFALWGYAWDIAQNNLCTGVGFYTGVDIAISRGMKLTQFHNMFFDLLVDGGILEVVFIGRLLYTKYERCSRKCINRKLLNVYRASLAAFLFYACFESVNILGLAYSDTMYSIFFVSLPLLLSNIKQETVGMGGDYMKELNER